jgi:hypothetical protein
MAMVETPAEILAKKVFYRTSDFTARDIFDLAFLIEQGEARFLNDKIYREKLNIIYAASGEAMPNYENPSPVLPEPGTRRITIIVLT